MTLRLVVGGNCGFLEGCCGSAVPDTLYTGWAANDGSALESKADIFRCVATSVVTNQGHGLDVSACVGNKKGPQRTRFFEHS